MNSSNATIDNSDYSFVIGCAVSIVYLVESAIGIGGSSLVVVSILKSKELLNNTFFLCVLATASTDVLCLALVIFYQVPSLCIGETLGPPLLTVVIAAVLNICWYAGSLFLLLSAFDRYTKLVRVQWCHLLDHARMRRCLLAAWVLACLFGIPSFLPCCTSSLFIDEYSWNYNSDVLEGAELLNIFDVTFTLSCVFSVYVISVVVLRSIWRRRGKRLTAAVESVRRQQRRETSIFFHFLADSVMAGVTEIFWNFLPLFTTIAPITVLGSMIYLACRSAHPFVLLFANSQIRKKVREMMEKWVCCKKSQASKSEVKETTAAVASTGPKIAWAVANETLNVITI